MKKTDKVTDKKTEVESFETKLNQLKDIVEKMNSGSLSLDESLNYFEKGIGLYKTCKSQLDKAEMRIKIIVQDKDEYKEIDFDQTAEE